MNRPRYSYQAINALASNETGHFVYLDAWSLSLLNSMLSQERATYLWFNNQFPLNIFEEDDLDNKLSTAQGQLMQSLVGLIMPIAVSTLPQGTLLCDGSTYLRADYPALYSAIDPVFIVDANTFVVPDMRDKFVVGVSGTKAVGTNGGSGSTTLTVNQLPSHNHTTQPHTHNDTPHSHVEGIALPSVTVVLVGAPVPSAIPGVGVTGLASVGILPASVTVDNTGNGDPIEVIPPYIALRYVVVAV